MQNHVISGTKTQLPQEHNYEGTQSLAARVIQLPPENVH